MLRRSSDRLSGVSSRLRIGVLVLNVHDIPEASHRESPKTSTRPDRMNTAKVTKLVYLGGFGNAATGLWKC